MKFVAVYTRVSTGAQDAKSQKPDLDKYVASLPPGTEVRWFTDKFTGKTMNRPGWNRLEDAMHQGQVSAVICWRLDRLGRTARGLTALFADLQDRKVNLVSLKDNIDLTTASGRMMAHVIASMAQYETEMRSERVQVGQALARKAGKTWGGSKLGVRKVVTDLQLKMVRQMKDEGEAITEIAKAVRLSRPTFYQILQK